MPFAAVSAHISAPPFHPVLRAGAPAQPPLVRRLPPLPHAGSGGATADLTPAQRRLMVAAILAAHLAAAYGLLQISAVRQAVLQAAPIFVDLIAPPAPPAPPTPPPPPPLPQPRPVVSKLPPPLPVLAAAPSPAPAPFVVPAPPPPEPAPAVPTPVQAVATPSPPRPAPPPAPPKLIAESDVQWLERPTPVYPSVSLRTGEKGRVIVRAFITAAGGPPREVAVEQSSGFPRLDDAALTAVRRARLKPQTENGVPVEGWTRIPFDFSLEK